MIRGLGSVRKFLVLVLIYWPSVGFGQVVLSDEVLSRLATQENPSMQGIEGTVQASKVQSALGNSQFDPRLKASYSYAASKEDAIIPFFPVFRPEKNLQIALEQKLSFGATLQTGVFGTQLNTEDGLISNATQVGAQVGLEIDIWRNFLGRLDRRDLRNNAINQQVVDLQGQIDRSSFILNIRKIYWSLVATERSLKLSESLIDTAKKQLRDAKRRARDGAGDAADVARNQAQVHSRESAVLFFSYQKERLFAQLKSLLPSLENQKLAVSLDGQAVMEAGARQCIGEIAAQEKSVESHSLYSEMIGLIEEQKSNAVALAEATDSPDIRLQARYQASGVSQSHGEAFDRLADDFKNGYQVGVAVNIPLGGDLKEARKSKVLASNYQLSAKKENLKLKMRSEHEKAQKALSLLGRAALSQESMIQSLNVSLKQAQRKYRQARIPLNTLVLEQDNFFNAELQHIETKRQIIDFLLDYFKIFPQHPCKINVLRGGQS